MAQGIDHVQCLPPTNGQNTPTLTLPTCIENDVLYIINYYVNNSNIQSIQKIVKSHYSEEEIKIAYVLCQDYIPDDIKSPPNRNPNRKVKGDKSVVQLRDDMITWLQTRNAGVAPKIHAVDYLNLPPASLKDLNLVTVANMSRKALETVNAWKDELEGRSLSGGQSSSIQEQLANLNAQVQHLNSLLKERPPAMTPPQLAPVAPIPAQPSIPKDNHQIPTQLPQPPLSPHSSTGNITDDSMNESLSLTATDTAAPYIHNHHQLPPPTVPTTFDTSTPAPPTMHTESQPPPSQPPQTHLPTNPPTENIPDDTMNGYSALQSDTVIEEHDADGDEEGYEFGHTRQERRKLSRRAGRKRKSYADVASAYETDVRVRDINVHRTSPPVSPPPSSSHTIRSRRVPLPSSDRLREKKEMLSCSDRQPTPPSEETRN